MPDRPRFHLLFSMLGWDTSSSPCGGNVQTEEHSKLPRASSDRKEGALGDDILWKEAGHVPARPELLWAEGWGLGRSHGKSCEFGGC